MTTATMEREVDPMLGRFVGKHQIVRKLGEGGMGAVYIGQHPLLKTERAILEARFIGETRGTAAIKHPSIIMLQNAGIVSLIMVAAVACGSSEPPNCETAIRKASSKITAGDDRPSESEIAEVVSMCISEKWTGTVRTCLANASTPAQARACITGREVDEGYKRYVSRGKHIEAELNLSAIGKAAKVYYVENSSFPRASVPLTPATPCCASPSKRCSANPDDWEGVPAWDMLDFLVPEDHLFQYSYESDGKTFEAHAVGDLDCDGTTITYVLRGSSDRGNPNTELARPTMPD